MSKSAARPNGLIDYVKDDELIDFFYLKLTPEALLEKLHALSFTLDPASKDVPFHAQLRGYIAAVDGHGTRWIAKRIDPGEIRLNCLYEIVYYLDFCLETLSAPLCIARVGEDFFRITKVLSQAVQISSYNYLEEPFRLILANDLINRWLTFDEDRNPNNYMVIHNRAGEPLVAAIDFNHADLESTDMKITGREDRFGWHRMEKTRFLTLLKPESFEMYTYADFARRLALLQSLDTEGMKKICRNLFAMHRVDDKKLAETIVSNITMRAKYIHDYFSRWFKGKKVDHPTSDYSGLGNSFVSIYKKKI